MLAMLAMLAPVLNWWRSTFRIIISHNIIMVIIIIIIFLLI